MLCAGPEILAFLLGLDGPKDEGFADGGSETEATSCTVLSGVNRGARAEAGTVSSRLILAGSDGVKSLEFKGKADSVVFPSLFKQRRHTQESSVILQSGQRQPKLEELSKSTTCP